MHPPRHNGCSVECGHQHARHCPRYSKLEGQHNSARLAKLASHPSTRQYLPTFATKMDLLGNGLGPRWQTRPAGARPEIDTDFKELIDRRSDMVRRLTEHTREERRNLQQLDSSTRLGRAQWRADKEVQARAGRTTSTLSPTARSMCSVPPLQSLTDGKSELDRIYTNIMLAYNVPPQIFGKKTLIQNGHAASNRLTESAVQIYALYGNKLRNTCAALIGAITKDNMDDQFFIGF